MKSATPTSASPMYTCHPCSSSAATSAATADSTNKRAALPLVSCFCCSTRVSHRVGPATHQAASPRCFNLLSWPVNPSAFLRLDRFYRSCLPSLQTAHAPSAGYSPPDFPEPPPHPPVFRLPAFRSCLPFPTNPHPLMSPPSTRRSVSFPGPPSGETLRRCVHADTLPRQSLIQSSILLSQPF